LTGLTRIERVIVFAVCVLMAAFVALTFMTASFWLRLDRLQIADACAGRDVPIIYDRTFLRDFEGDWLVTVWHMERGDWVAWAGVNGSFAYKAATPPQNRDLDWLTGGDVRASRLPVGTWRVDVRVTANPGTIFSRTASVESNPFEVRLCSS